MHKQRIVCSALVLSSFFISSKTSSNTTPQRVISYKVENDKQTDQEFSEENLINYMKELGVKYIKLSIAQAKHESGNFTSYLFKHNNNLFGMRMAERRKTTAIGVHKHYAVYSNWQKSVEDFFLMQQKIIKKHDTKEKYIAYIKKNYSHDQSYIKKLNKYL